MSDPVVTPALYEAAARHYQGCLDRGTLPSAHPWVIHLETRSLCNSRCSFCAAAVTNPTRPPDALMPDALIDKILAELGDIGYANRLSLYNNNEPFLDKRIVDIVGRARKRLPRAYLEIKSNGTVLTTAKVLEVFNAGLDMLYVNDYVEDGAASPKIDALRRELRNVPRFAQRLAIATRQVDAVLNTRAGTAPNRITLRQPLTVPCFRPFEMMTVNPAGIVTVCSDDVYFRGSMGNVNDHTLMEIWHSDRWQEMRARLLRGERAGYGETCRDCDSCHPKTDMMVAVGVPVPRPPWRHRARAVLRGSRDRLLTRDAGSPVD